MSATFRQASRRCGEIFWVAKKTWRRFRRHLGPDPGLDSIWNPCILPNFAVLRHWNRMVHPNLALVYSGWDKEEMLGPCCPVSVVIFLKYSRQLPTLHAFIVFEVATFQASLGSSGHICVANASHSCSEIWSEVSRAKVGEFATASISKMVRDWWRWSLNSPTCCVHTWSNQWYFSRHLPKAWRFSQRLGVPKQWSCNFGEVWWRMSYGWRYWCPCGLSAGLLGRL